MDRAFSSSRQAAAFAFLLLLLLLLPVLVGKQFLPSRGEMYLSAGRQTIDFPHLHQQIFEEKGDIDIAIMGSSRLGCAMNSDYVQTKLSEKLGRPAVVRQLTWTWNGYDALYFIARDLLEHRGVHTLVISDLSYDLSPSVGNFAHHQTSYWFRLADSGDALADLPTKSKASFYASAILGLPRNLVGLLRPNLAALPANENGVAWNHSPLDYAPPTSVTPSDVQLYSDATKAKFQFLPQPTSPMQLAFARKIGALAKAHHTQLIFVDLPDFDDRGETLINETADWPAAFQTNLAIVGIAPATLFAGLSDDDIRKLYYNPTHFNQNGANYLTPLLTPSLIQLYEAQP